MGIGREKIDWDDFLLNEIFSPHWGSDDVRPEDNSEYSCTTAKYVCNFCETEFFKEHWYGKHGNKELGWSM